MKEIKKELEKRLTPDERIKLLGHTAGSIICTLAKYLIQTSGYGITSRILLREIRELGKKDAKKIMEIFGIKERSPENASKILKIIALNIGLKLEKRKNGTVVTECPYGECVKEFEEPFICKVCLEYNKGVIEAVLGPGFTLKRSKYLLDNGLCDFRIEKKS